MSNYKIGKELVNVGNSVIWMTARFYVAKLKRAKDGSRFKEYGTLRSPEEKVGSF